jgi:hypothetical protein
MFWRGRSRRVSISVFGCTILVVALLGVAVGAYAQSAHPDAWGATLSAEQIGSSPLYVQSLADTNTRLASAPAAAAAPKQGSAASVSTPNRGSQGIGHRDIPTMAYTCSSTCGVTCYATSCSTGYTCASTCYGSATCGGATCIGNTTCSNTCAGTATCTATCSGATCGTTCAGSATCSGSSTCGTTCAGSATCGSACGAPVLTLQLSGLKSGAIKLGKSVTAKGTVTPTSLAGSKVTLTVQKKSGTRWVKAKTGAATLGATGAYSWKYKPAKKGAYRVQAKIAETTTSAAAMTKWRSFKVK